MGNMRKSHWKLPIVQRILKQNVPRKATIFYHEDSNTFCFQHVKGKIKELATKHLSFFKDTNGNTYSAPAQIEEIECIRKRERGVTLRKITFKTRKLKWTKINERYKQVTDRVIWVNFDKLTEDEENLLNILVKLKDCEVSETLKTLMHNHNKYGNVNGSRKYETDEFTIDNLSALGLERTREITYSHNADHHYFKFQQTIRGTTKKCKIVKVKITGPKPGNQKKQGYCKIEMELRSAETTSAHDAIVLDRVMRIKVCEDPREDDEGFLKVLFNLPECEYVKDDGKTLSASEASKITRNPFQGIKDLFNLTPKSRGRKRSRRRQKSRRSRRSKTANLRIRGISEETVDSSEETETKGYGVWPYILFGASVLGGAWFWSAD